MSRTIVRLDDPRTGEQWYCVWSSVVDAPVWPLIPVGEDAEASAEIAMEAAGWPHWEGWKKHLLEHGYAACLTLEDVLRYNRAGPGETHLEKVEQLIDRYHTDSPGWSRWREDRDRHRLKTDRDIRRGVEP